MHGCAVLTSADIDIRWNIGAFNRNFGSLHTQIVFARLISLQILSFWWWTHNKRLWTEYTSWTIHWSMSVIDNLWWGCWIWIVVWTKNTDWIRRAKELYEGGSRIAMELERMLLSSTRSTVFDILITFLFFRKHFVRFSDFSETLLGSRRFVLVWMVFQGQYSVGLRENPESCNSSSSLYDLSVNRREYKIEALMSGMHAPK